MKNIELARTPDILKYKGVLDKIKSLDKREYTFREAAEYFGCLPSQISGYCYNYKELLEDYMRIDNLSRKKVIKLNCSGMFLIALLLGKKTEVSNAVVNNVLELIEGKQLFMDVIGEKTIGDNITIKNGVINFESLKKAKESKNEEPDLEFIRLNFGPNGITSIPLRKEKEEEIADNTIKSLEDIPQELKDLLNEIREEVLERFSNIEEDETDEDFENEDEDCNCPECLTENFNNMIKESNAAKLQNETLLDMQLIYTEKYMDICNVLGIDKLDAAIMIQKSIIKESDNIDSEILNYLLSEKRKMIDRQMGVIKESIKLLAEEKFDSVRETYMFLAQELRCILGTDLMYLIEDSKYYEFLETIVNAKAFKEVTDLIYKYLTE